MKRDIFFVALIYNAINLLQHRQEEAKKQKEKEK